jgi:hypothetical protein
MVESTDLPPLRQRGLSLGPSVIERAAAGAIESGKEAATPLGPLGSQRIDIRLRLGAQR